MWQLGAGLLLLALDQQHHLARHLPAPAVPVMEELKAEKGQWFLHIALEDLCTASVVKVDMTLVDRRSV
jgi:hypothetical protein